MTDSILAVAIRKEAQIAVSDLICLLDYESTTGLLRWQPRDGAPLQWNTRFAGSVAGSRNRGGIGVRLVSGGKTTRIYGHRIAWAIYYGAWPLFRIDHEDGDDCNNAIVNLRAATPLENMMNKTKASGLFPFKGVVRWRNKCRAQIVIGGKSKHLGVFDDPRQAALAYDEAAIIYFGAYAKTNKELGLL